MSEPILIRGRVLVAKRRERLVELERAWTRKAKLAATRLRTIRRRLAGYERRSREEAAA